MKRFLAGLTAAVALAVSSAGVASAGTVWTIQSAPLPSNGRSGSLDGVSCWSKGGCIAVGSFFYRKRGFRSHALAEEWNGTAWTIQALRRPGPTWRSNMSGVSCVSARSCTAVGTSIINPETAVAERWNGSTWAVQPVKSPAGTGTSLSSVSCTAAARCTAVGFIFQAGKERPLAERWDGRAWAIQPTPAPSGSAASHLSAVSCGTVGSCMAVGTIQAPSSTIGPPLAESWDGSAWTLQAIPDPSGSVGTQLTGLSCASATSCMATGDYYTQPVSGPLVLHSLAESWDGTAWTIQPTPVSGGGADSVLSAVSCVSPASCTAIGFYARGGLAEYWNGSVWRQQQTTHPAGHNLLFGLSCLFPHSCTAVGAVRRPGVGSGPLKPLAEQE